jgi:thiol-disulfide isomerase/thioredoxin
MNSSQKWIGIIALGAIVLSVGLYFLLSGPREPGKLDGFAQCIKDSGAVFYGAFWCPHCQEQKEMFGSSAQFLPYVECSTPDGQGQLQVCTEKGIKGYPTWVFPDGSEVSGSIPLEQLAAKTGCALPQ